MRYIHSFLFVPLVNGFAFPNFFHRKEQHDEPTCQNPVVYTVIEYPCAIQTFVPSNTLLIAEACNASISVTNGPTYIDTILTSTTTLKSTSTFTTTQTVTVPQSPTSSSSVSSSTDAIGNAIESSTVTSPTKTPPEDATTTKILDDSSSATPFVPPLLRIKSSVEVSPIPTVVALLSSISLILPEISTSTSGIAPNVVSSTSPVETPNCLPSTSGYPGVNVVPANTTWLLQLYYLSNNVPVSTGAYLTNTSGYTYTASDAIHVFFNDGILFALDETFGIGFYATASPPVDAPFSLQEYVPNAGLTAKTFSSEPNWPYALTWENCGFTVDPATFVWNEDAGNIYVVFDGNQNQGTNHEPMVLGLVPPP